MPKRFRKVAAAIAALAALGLGGAVFAQAQSGSESAGGPDRDNIQAGDQTTPDAPAAATRKAAASEQPGVEQPEQSSESSPANDGPGGHADATGSSSSSSSSSSDVNHEFQGTE